VVKRSGSGATVRASGEGEGESVRASEEGEACERFEG
jgi:hypothetical protein